MIQKCYVVLKVNFDHPTSAIMTYHRFLYKLCWRSRYLLPFLLAAIIIGVVLLSGPGTSVEFGPDGKPRLRYKHRHGLVPRMENSQPLPIANPAHQPPPVYHQGHGHNHAIGDVPAVHLVPRKPNEGHVHSQRMKDSHLENKLQIQEDESNIEMHIRRATAANPGQTRVKSKTRHQHARTGKQIDPGWKTSLYYNASNPPSVFVNWNSRKEEFCEGNLVGYSNEFSHLNNLLIDMGHCHFTNKGGEEIKEVLNQSEDQEYFTYSLGCFQTPCKKRPSYYFNNKNHMNEWMLNLKTKDLHTGSADKLISDFTIAVVRYEYANIYHTMTDWYNAFMMMQFFNKTQRETNILFVDTHPLGALDPVWPVLFNSSLRMASLPQKTVFTDMTWNVLGYNSPMLEFYNPELPLVEEFREFFLSSYRINAARRLDCQQMSLLFIWRKDYLAHPRNPEGTVSRKFYNEQEMLNKVQTKFKQHRVKGVQIDLFDMRQQLQFISDADILVGMHGAGLTHTMFLQNFAGLIEFVPNYFSSSNEHFSAIASWRKLHYQKWVNLDPENELPGDETKIPPKFMDNILEDMIQRVCGPQVTSNATSYQQHESYFEPKYIDTPEGSKTYLRADDIDSNAFQEVHNDRMLGMKRNPVGSVIDNGIKL